MRMKWGWVAIAVLLLTGCGHDPAPVKIGLASGLTGKYSQLGVASMYGAQLACDDINEAGGIDGRPVELVIRDDRNDLETALEVDQELVDEEVVAIVGHLISAMADTVAYANEQMIPMLSPTIATDELTGLDDYFIRLIPSNREQARQIASEAVADRHRELAILYEIGNQKFSKVLSDFLISDFEQAGGRIIDYSGFESSDQVDYLGIARKYVESETTAMAIIASGYDVAGFAQAFDILGHDVQLYIPSWGLTADLFQYGGKVVNGIQGVSYFDLASSNAEYLDFASRYEARYGLLPSFSSAFSYEAVRVIAEAMEGLENPDGPTLKSRILEIARFKGLQSEIRFDAFGDVTRPVYTYVANNGRFMMKTIQAGGTQ